jgi:hypothetical protein
MRGLDVPGAGPVNSKGEAETFTRERRTAMLRMRRFLVPVICVALSTSLASAAESTLTADFDVQRVRPADAVVVLRTLANTRQIVVVDDHTVRVSDDESKIADVRAIVGLIEKPAEGSVASVQLADGTTVAIVALRRASAIDVLKALRAKLQIRRVATLDTDDSSSSILVRDTNEKAQEALKLIAEMDGGSGTKRSDNP